MHETVHRTEQELESLKSYLENMYQADIDKIANDIAGIAKDHSICHHNMVDLSSYIGECIFDVAMKALPDDIRKAFDYAINVELHILEGLEGGSDGNTLNLDSYR